MADVPYELWKSQGEAAFHMIIHVMFRSIEIHLHSEVSSAHGRADIIVETKSHIYCFEFKVESSAASAVRQIKDRGYLDKFSDDKRTRIAIGISFDKQNHKVADWSTEII